MYGNFETAPFTKDINGLYASHLYNIYQLYIILYDIHHIKIIPNHIPDLGLIVDVADLLDDESELIVPGQRLVHHVEV